jgi:GT2 family glycosyltransferase
VSSKRAPLASVIVVCWNSADVVGRCLDHLLAQDVDDYEIVLVDDGSQDRTVEIAERSLSSGRLTIVRSPLNRGCPHARNLGLKHARGEIIAFIDGDGFATRSWLRNVIAEFQCDATVGGVASTVFMEDNPLVLNGAGGIVNRQGWAADLSMNLPYQVAKSPTEVLYPMGCGMAVRRSAVKLVGPFDDHMLNYYDDVDYGVRLWRAGYRVVVARDAWIDHGFGHSGGESTHKQLLCEQHRMRIVLKHAPASTIARWLFHELFAMMRATWPRRELKLQAIRWNARNLLSTLVARWRLRSSPRAPDRLSDPSWGENFPTGVPKLVRPTPAKATSTIDMADKAVERLLPYGWFPSEQIHGRRYRWAGRESSALIRLEKPAKRLRLEYANVPVDTGGIELKIHRLGSGDPLGATWRTRLRWQFIERSVENHPISLPAGDYEVQFAANRVWSDPPLDTRELGFALARLSFEATAELAPSELDMHSSRAEDQLVNGWFEPEPLGEKTYRWTSGQASAMVHLDDGARGMQMTYCLPPAAIGGIEVSVRPLHRSRSAWSTRIEWRDGQWHEERFAMRLAPGDYLVSFRADSTWSNAEAIDPAFSPENRALGIAVSSITFDDHVDTARKP